MIGTKGLCSVYEPPVSYWCSEHPSGGGAFAFRTPSGMTPKAGALPNAPYKDVSEAIINVWRPARWANWMFEVSGYDATTNNFTFGKGGFQGARGNDKGGDFFVENIFEELDHPGGERPHPSIRLPTCPIALLPAHRVLSGLMHIYTPRRVTPWFVCRATACRILLRSQGGQALSLPQRHRRAAD